MKNYLLIPQKQWIAGLTLSHGEFDSKDNNLLIFIKDFNFKGNITTLNPFVGYFIKDNECIGIKLGYSHLSANLDNLDIDIDDDMQFNLGDIRYLGETFSAALFHRAYIGIDKQALRLLQRNGISLFKRFEPLCKRERRVIEKYQDNDI